MKFDVSIMSADEYIPGELVQEIIPEKYLFTDKGDFILASIVFNSEETAHKLVNFLFQMDQRIPEFCREKDPYLLDLTPYRHRVIDVDQLETHYPEWLENTGSKNDMNKYGSLIDVIGFAQKGNGKKHLIMTLLKKRNLHEDS